MRKTNSLQAKIQLRDNKYVVIAYRNKRWKTGISVDSPSHFKGGRLTSEFGSAYKSLNLHLSEKLQFFNRLILEAARQELDTLDYINSYLEQEQSKLKKLSITKNTTLIQAFEEYLEVKKNKMKDFRKERSFQRYVSELSRLKDYHKVTPTKILDIDLNWFYDFARWLSKPQLKTFDVIDSKNDRIYQAKKEIVQTNSTIKRFIQDLITFLKFLKEGQPKLDFPIDDITEFMNSLKSKENNSDDIIALSDEQYQAIMNFKSNPNKPWEVDTLNLFKFCLQTGLRYSDAIILDKIDINEQNIIEMKATKTSCFFRVPLNNIAKEIFQIYECDFKNKFPKNQQINKNLRKILKQIPEFNIEQKTYHYRLGDVLEKKVKAYKLISFHASRRTFVSRAIRKRATLDQIKKWTGWTDLRTLTHYLEVFGNNHDDDLAILN
jgi:integrase